MTTEERQSDRSDAIDVRQRFKGFLDAGSRFIALVVRESEDGMFELIYAFDQGGKVADFRFSIPLDQEVDSVADLYPGAMTAEREAVDLFGVRFKGVRPGLFLVEGKSPPEPPRKRRSVEKGVTSWLGPRSVPSAARGVPGAAEREAGAGGGEGGGRRAEPGIQPPGIYALPDYKKSQYLCERVYGICSYHHLLLLSGLRPYGVEVPMRARLIRTIMMECQRLTSHLLALGHIARPWAMRTYSCSASGRGSSS